jgi:hypothetical protein
VTDPHSALRAYLIAASPLRTLLGGDFVYWPEVPAGTAGMPKRAVSFRGSGGFNRSGNLKVQDARISFRCWGNSAYQAMEVYRALHDRLHDIQNLVIAGTGFHGIEEEVPGQPLEDPVSKWPFVFCTYSVKVSTIAIPSLV